VREQLAAHHGELTVIERDLAASRCRPSTRRSPTPTGRGGGATAILRAGAVRNADRRTRSGRHGADHHADAQLHGAGIAEDVDRPGRAAERTFAGTPQGKQGLLRDRPVLAVVSCGGRFSDDAASQRTSSRRT
jgi:FMN-dependent NADH-azoreductase